jgi:signal transduction histidine kinase
LLRNALEAVTTGGRIEIAVESLPGGGRISIRDNGPGLSETDREHLFDPFYSGRPAGRGLGFGLSKCWRVVAQHNGTISVTNTDGGGVIATVNWPA